MNKDIFAGFIAKYFNKCADKGVFPDDLKYVTPIHKKKDKSDKTDYRPVTILLNTSKIYEKLIYNRLCDYFDDIKPPSQCDFRKGHSTQHYLLVMLENVENLQNKGNKCGAVLTDLSKAFDSIDCKLLFVKTILV